MAGVPPTRIDSRRRRRCCGSPGPAVRRSSARRERVAGHGDVLRAQGPDPGPPAPGRHRDPRRGADRVTLAVSPETVVPGRYGLWLGGGAGHARVGDILERDGHAGHGGPPAHRGRQGHAGPRAGPLELVLLLDRPAHEHRPALPRRGRRGRAGPDAGLAARTAGVERPLGGARPRPRRPAARSASAPSRCSSGSASPAWSSPTATTRPPRRRRTAATTSGSASGATSSRPWSMRRLPERRERSSAGGRWAERWSCRRSSRPATADFVDAVFLDAPVVDWGDVLAHHARLHHIPPPLRDLGTLVMGRRATRHLVGRP